MKKRNTLGIQFVIRLPKQQKKELASVYARVTVNGRRSEISLKAKIAPHNWDTIKGKAKGKKEEFTKLNAHIDRVRSLITDCYHQLIQQRKAITVEAVKSLYLGEDDQTAITLFKLADYHKQVETGKLARGTMKNYSTTELYLKTFSIERLQSVLDMFLFSCYTGLAYIDISQLSQHHIVKGIDAKDWLMTSRQKTNTTVKVPLLPEAVLLIFKYSNHPSAIAGGTVFPVISNQRMNGYLKEIADLCAIKKNLTFHLARHTFATTVTLSNGVPIESVSKMLGHTSIFN